jgi:rubrerythrin
MSQSGQCIGCKHYTFNATCEAFPDHIPHAIFSGQVIHTKPYPGDCGIQYDPIIPGDEDDDEYEEKSAMEPSALDRLPYLDFSHLRKSLDYGDIHVPRLVGDDMEDDGKMKEEDEELEKEGSDSDAILALLQDEKGGVESLTQVLESVQDPKLKEILEAVLEDEQKHQAAFEQYIQENGGGSEDGEGQDEPSDEGEGEGEPGEVEADADGPTEIGEIPDDEPGEDESPEGPGAGGSKEDLIDEIRAILEQHESPGEEEAEKAEEVEGKPKAESEEDEDEGEETEKCTLKSYKVSIIKGDQQIVYGVVSEPDTIDLQGDRLSESEIRKACHKFMMESQRIGKEHEGQAKADIIESYIAPTDFVCGGQKVRKGSWVMAIKIHDPKIWQSVKKGDITGLSIAGKGDRVPFGN